jgi:hydroxymethylbilane synthase
MKAMREHLVIGTRGSKLALIQTQLVADALYQRHPGLKVETKIITTKGDTNQSPIPLDTVGKAWFTAEIEQALQSGVIDIAAHSLKDLPPESGAGLMSLPVLERADPRDVLVSKSGHKLGELPAGAIVGTDSLRRKAGLLLARPDLRVESVRGNVQTRLLKLREQHYDAIVLAAAGLERLDQLDIVTEYLDPAHFVPAVCQGVLAAEVRQTDHELVAVLAKLQHAPTLAAVKAEQAFSRIIGGGCKLPVACYARIDDDQARLFAMVGDSQGLNAELASASGKTAQAPAMAERLARKLTAGKALT